MPQPSLTYNLKVVEKPQISQKQLVLEIAAS